jgi:hypothetical protein
MSSLQTNHFHDYIVYISLRYETYNQMVSQLWSGLFHRCYLILQHIYYHIIFASVVDETVSFLSSSFLFTSEGLYEHLSMLHILVFILQYQFQRQNFFINSFIHFSSVSIMVAMILTLISTSELSLHGSC